MTKSQGHNRWTASRIFGAVQRIKTFAKWKIRVGDPTDRRLPRVHGKCLRNHWEKVEVDGVDKIVNLTKMWADLLVKAKADPLRKVKVELSTGQVLTGSMHEEFTRKGMKLKGAQSTQRTTIAPSLR